MILGVQLYALAYRDTDFHNLGSVAIYFIELLRQHEVNGRRSEHETK